MKTCSFDVCVLGQGIGGLVSALMLQKQGAKVVILKNQENSSFDSSLFEFLNGFTLKPVLKRIGFHPTEVNAIPSLPAPLQIVIPDHRVNCYGEENRFERELMREFPDHSKQILQLFKESSGHLELYQHLFNSRVPMPPRGFLSRYQFQRVLKQVCDERLLKVRSFDEELKSFGIGEKFSRILEVFQYGLTGLRTNWITGARLAHLLTLVRWEGYAAPLGLATISDMLFSKIAEHGGAVAHYEEIKELDFKGRSLSGFHLTGSDWEEIRSNTVIISGDPRGLISINPQAYFLHQLEKQMNSLTISALKAYQMYRLAPQGIPVGMKSQGIYVPPPRENGEERRELIRALRYKIHRKSNGTPSQEEVWLALTVFLRVKDDAPDSTRLNQDIRNGIKNVIPFIEQYLIEEPEAPYISCVKGRAGDFKQGFIYTTSHKTILGVCGSSSETPLKNTFLAGDMVFPGLGLDGEIIAGLQASHLAAKRLSIGSHKL